METWTHLCRCCLSPDSEVDIFDTERNTKQKFLETTSIEVKEDDGLPQRLCSGCFSKMISAYQFRNQCVKMDSELKTQLQTILKQSGISSKLDKAAEEMTTAENDSALNVKDIQGLIKQEPSNHGTDTDDDYYYVLVIDDKEKEKENALKREIMQDPPEETNEDNFEKSVDSFLLTNPHITIPVSNVVPNTILANEDDQFDDNIETEGFTDRFELENISISESTAGKVNNFEKKIVALTQSNDTNIIKIITNGETTEGILLQGTESGGEIVTYLTDDQLANADGDSLSQEEVIVCEGDDSRFQIVKCEGSELVIEYANDSVIQEDGLFLCDCGEKFEDLADYEKHQWTHNPGGEYLCSLCGKGFESDEILTGHMLLHKMTGLLVMCPFCNQFVKRNTLTQHIKYSHNNIKPLCKVCLKTFANPNNLKRHMMIHSGIRQFECDICFKRFHQKITMQTHRLTHIDPYACNECDKMFENKNQLDDHKESNECDRSKVKLVVDDLIKKFRQEIRTHDGKTLGFACSMCKKMFSVETAFEQHIETHHVTDPMELLCSECGEVLPSKKEMLAHTTQHKQNKSRSGRKFVCGVCGKGCASQAMLIMHERVHTNERPYPCQLCALRFKTKTHLRTHQLTHTREKKFGCSICLKFFALKGNLVVHLRTHTGERPYICSLCGDAFIDSKYLKKHKLRKHAIDNVPWNQY